MKSLKLFLAVAFGLFFFVLCVVVYLWWQLQTLQHPAYEERSVENTDAPATSTTEDISIAGRETDLNEHPIASEVTEPIVIERDSLTESQRNVLNTVGIDIKDFTITKEMVICAETKLGSDRLREILDGDQPGPLESLTFLACAKNGQ